MRHGFLSVASAHLMRELGLFDLVPAMCALDYSMSEVGGASHLCGNVPLPMVMTTAIAGTRGEADIKIIDDMRIYDEKTICKVLEAAGFASVVCHAEKKSTGFVF